MSLDFVTDATTWWRRPSRVDRVALAWIVAIPLVLFVVPALVGHPALTQDNLIQNFPLRVLSGRQMAGGHLPLMNPLTNSGTPLLGGLNAGSFFPLTFLFVALPAIAAWVLNLIAVYVVGALGMFALLRWHGQRTLAALVPALTYTYSGAMIGQMVHLGVIQGFALLPWTVLVQLALARAIVGLPLAASVRQRARTVAPFVVALAALWGLTTLSGEPRAIAEMQLLLLILGPSVLLLRSSLRPATWTGRGLYVASTGIGVFWGALIGLAQLLPGWSFINISQRTGLTYQFFGSGSLVVRWTGLMLVPDLFGGNGVLGQPRYFVGYNLSEVTGYVGVVALVALASYLTQRTRRGWPGASRDYALYVVVIVVGLFATWGSFTPFGHLFQAIPLFGSTRLQSRNIILVDLGLAVLLGWWLERLAERDFAGAGLVGWRRWTTLSPVIATALLSGAMVFASGPLIRFLNSSNQGAAMAAHEWPTDLAHLLVATALGVIILWGRTRQRLVRWIVVVTTVDVVLFLVFCSLGFISGSEHVMPSRAPAAAQLGDVGRFALVDPTGQHQNEFDNLGSPNLNVFTGLLSVQGYGSLIDALYGNVTATHPQFSLDPCRMASGTFRQLRLATIVIDASQLATPRTRASVEPLDCLSPERAITTRRYFGRRLEVRSIELVGVGRAKVSPGLVSVQLLDSSGRPYGVTLRERGTSMMRFSFARYGESAVGVQVDAARGARFASSDVEANDPGPASYRLTTPFQLALATSSWRLRSTEGTLSFFRATALRPSAWLGADATGARITVIRNTAWGDSWITVRTRHPVVVQRSMEWIPGWRASALNARTGQNTALRVVRAGLIQQVTVPPGSWTVHFHYHAPHIELGLIGSLLGLGAWVTAVGYLRAGRRRMRNTKVRS